jgi:PleD family two-component response regulator
MRASSPGYATKERGDVLILAMSVLEFEDLALDAGVDAFLLKPLRPQLQGAVRLRGQSSRIPEVPV